MQCHFEGEDIPLGRSSSSSRDVDFESGRGVSNAETPAGVLHDIAMKCGTKVIRKRIIVRDKLRADHIFFMIVRAHHICISCMMYP